MKIRRDYGTVAFALAGSVLFLANTTAATADDLVLKSLETSYVGGTIEFSDCNDSRGCDNNRFPPGTIRVNSMYVQTATPANKTFNTPIALLHGGGHNGQVFMTTPDGREGWFTSLIRRGFEVSVLDGSNRGRAGWDPVRRILATVEETGDMENTNTYSLEAACDAFRLGNVNPNPNMSKCNFFGNTQFPKKEMDQYLAQLNPAYRDAEANTLLAKNIEALIDENDGKIVLAGWSTGGTNVSDAMTSSPERAAKVAAFISVEGGDTRTCRTNPECVAAIATRPYLNIQGDRSNPTNAGLLVGLLDAAQPSVPHETIFLPDIGIEGNGHTMMLEENNEEIADVIEDWVRANADQ